MQVAPQSYSQIDAQVPSGQINRSASVTAPSLEDRLACTIANEVTMRLQTQLSRMESRLDALMGQAAAGEVQPRNGAASQQLPGGSCGGDKEAEISSRELMMSWTNETHGMKESDEGSSSELLNEKPTLWQRFNACREAKEPERKGTSALANLVLSTMFPQVSFLVVVFNTVFMWYKTDYESEQLDTLLPLGMRVMECSFVAFYTVELVLRLCVHGRYFFWNADMGWNIFDLLIVMAGLGEVLVVDVLHLNTMVNPAFLRVSRLLRVIRVLRILRTVRFLQELEVMIESILSSMLSLFWACALMAMMLMIASIILVQSMTAFRIDNKDAACADSKVCDEIQGRFGFVSTTMFTLFECVTGGVSWGDMYDYINLGSALASGFFVFFILFFLFAFFNIVTSVFVDKAMKLSKPDVEILTLERQEEEAGMAEELGTLFEHIDKDGSGVVTIPEVEAASKDPSVFHRFELLGISIRDADTFFSTLQSMTEDGELDKDDFVEGCLRMKGPASAVMVQAVLFAVTKNLKHACIRNARRRRQHNAV